MNFNFLSTNAAFSCFVPALGFGAWADGALNGVYRTILRK